MTDETVAAEEPLELRWLRAHGLHFLTPWHFLEVDRPEGAAGFRNEFQKETMEGSVPERDFLPFAKRQDQDDVAGLVVEDGAVTSKVIVAHLTWTGRPERPGYPTIERFPNLWAWLKQVVDDTAEWCSEEDMPEPGTS